MGNRQHLLLIGALVAYLGLAGCSQNDKPGDGHDGDEGDGPDGSSAGAVSIPGLIYDPKDGFIYAGVQKNCTLWQCDPTKKGSCKNWADNFGCMKDDGGITSLVLSPDSGHIYVGLVKGEIWRCNTGGASACVRYESAKKGNTVLALAYDPDDAYIYAGLNDGTLWKCDPTQRDNCETLNKGEKSLVSLTYNPDNGFIYAVLDRAGLVWKCNPKATSQCSTIDDFTDHGNGSSPGSVFFNAQDGLIYVGVSPVGVQRCDANIKNQCTTLSGPTATDPDNVVSVLTANPTTGSIFAGDSTGKLWKCPQGKDACTPWGTLSPLKYGDNWVTSLVSLPGPESSPSDIYCAGQELTRDNAESVCQEVCETTGLMWSTYWQNEAGTICRPDSVCGCDRGFIFAGDWNATLWRCSSGTANSCEVFERF